MLTLVALVATLAPSSELTLDRIFSDPPLEGKTPAQLQLSPGGKYVTFLRGSDKDSDVLDHEKRLIRIETMIELTRGGGGVPRLP